LGRRPIGKLQINSTVRLENRIKEHLFQD